MKSFEVFVTFDDGDPAGIVFFGNYFRMAHRALEQYFIALGIGYEGWFRRPGIGIPLRHVEADYMSPIRPGQSVWFFVGVDQIGNSSVTFKYWVREKNDPASKLLAELKTVHVFLDLKERKKISVPDDLRAALSN